MMLNPHSSSYSGNIAPCEMNRPGDLPAAVETAVREVAGLNPPDQPSDTRAKDLVAKFYEFWTEATPDRISALKCYVPKGGT